MTHDLAATPRAAFVPGPRATRRRAWIGRRILMSIAILPALAGLLCAGGEPGAARGARPDPGDASYWFDGREVSLVGGESETEAAPGSSAEIRTAIFGTPAFGHLNGDGNEDAAVLLVQETGGSGAFYYAAAVLSRTGGVRGTDAVLLGDRVAPQNVAINEGTVVVNYIDRRPGEPMTAPPSEGKTLRLVAQGGELMVLPSPAAPGFLAGIAGIEWKLVRLVVDGKDLPLAADAVPTFVPEITGKVQGLATLNRYFGQVVFDRGGRLHWSGPFGSTMMAGPEPLMHQERAFLSALGKARQAMLEGGRLVFQDGAGRVSMEFTR